MADDENHEDSDLLVFLKDHPDAKVKPEQVKTRRLKRWLRDLDEQSRSGVRQAWLIGRALNVQRAGLKRGEVGRWEKDVAKKLDKEPRTLQLYRQIAEGLDDPKIATALRRTHLDGGLQSVARCIRNVRGGRQPEQRPPAPNPKQKDERLRKRMARWLDEVEDIPDPVSTLRWARDQLDAKIRDVEPTVITSASGTTAKLIRGDSLVRLQGIQTDSVGAVITDPPYGISFAGLEWDKPGDGKGNEGQQFGRWCEAWLREAFRVLKPGGLCKVFSAPRTYHRVTTAMEAVGFELRPFEAWAHEPGMPKGVDVSKAIDRLFGTPGEVIGTKPGWKPPPGYVRTGEEKGKTITVEVRAPGSEEAARWQGWHTGLAPAWEPILVGAMPAADQPASAAAASGGSGRLHCVPKASPKEKRAGLKDLDMDAEGIKIHPTVKPIRLMVELLADVPQDALVLDPFSGSGTTGIACVETGHDFIGIEMDQGYVKLAAARIRHAGRKRDEIETADHRIAGVDGTTPNPVDTPRMRTIHLLRKPASEDTVTKNALKYGTGALNIDATRTAWAEDDKPKPGAHPGGRGPTNLILQHLETCREVDGVWRCAPDCPVSDVAVGRYVGSVGGAKTRGDTDGDDDEPDGDHGPDTDGVPGG